jgi:hypothetical protein
VWGASIPKDAPVDGPNERCIEVPLAREVMQLTTPGRVLDVGCAVNGHLQDDLTAAVFHLTQNIGSETVYAHKRVPLSYLSGDVRDLSYFVGAAFDRVVCVSTLEHVGFNNESYLGPDEDCPDTMLKGFRELCRVTRSQLLVTVPYSEEAWRCNKWRYLQTPTLGRMVWIAANCGFRTDLRFYAKCDGGWYGGEPEPVAASLTGFPQSVNAIACLLCTQ